MELTKREMKVLKRYSDDDVKSAKRIVVVLCGLFILACVAKFIFWRDVSKYDYMISSLFVLCVIYRDVYVREKIIVF